MIISGRQQRDSAIYIHVPLLPQTPLPYRLSHNIEQCSLCYGASLVALAVKNLPPMQETWVQSLGWEDSLGKERATHSRILARRIPWTAVLYSSSLLVIYLKYSSMCILIPNSLTLSSPHASPLERINSFSVNLLLFCR